MATTRTDLGQYDVSKFQREQIKTESKKSPQQKCQESGGYWDAQTQTCVRIQKPTPTPTPNNKTPLNSSIPGSVVMGENNKSVGFINSKGDFVKAGGADIQNVVNKQIAQQIPGGVSTEQIASAQILQQQQDLLTSSGTQLTPDGRRVVSDGGVIENVATGGAALAGGLTGAKFGAGIGTLIAPGVGTVIGGVVGGIGGAVGGAYVKLRIQKTQDIKEANKVFTQAKTNKQEILNMINANLVTEGQARELWQEEKQNIAATQTYLKKQTQSELNAFLGQPGDDLIAVESYLRLDNFYDLEFEKALLQPNQTKIRFPQSE